MIKRKKEKYKRRPQEKKVFDKVAWKPKTSLGLKVKDEKIKEMVS